MELLSVTKENFDKVTAAAVADKHYCIAPTHYWKNKQGEIAGFFSAGIIPVCHFWMKRDSKPKDSLAAIRACEKFGQEHIPFIRETGVGIIACSVESPFYPVLHKHLKYKELVTDTSLFLTNFKSK